jgi:hypothetical protein
MQMLNLLSTLCLYFQVNSHIKVKKEAQELQSAVIKEVIKVVKEKHRPA